MSICASVRQIWKPQLCSLVYHRRLNCNCLDSSISSYIASRTESIQKTYATASELGRNPVRKHQIQPEYGDEQADAGRNCRTRLAIHYYLRRERAGQREILFSLLSRPRAGLQPLLPNTVDQYILFLYV